MLAIAEEDPSADEPYAEYKEDESEQKLPPWERRRTE